MQQRGLLASLAAKVAIATLFAAALLGFLSIDRITYLESQELGAPGDAYITVGSPATSLVQEFASPYDCVTKVELMVGTYGSTTNSRWQAALVDPASGRELCRTTFVTSRFEDNHYSVVLSSAKGVRLARDATYELHLSAIDINPYSKLALHHTSQSAYAGVLRIDDAVQTGDLNLRIYGGDADPWWMVESAALLACGLALSLLIRRNHCTSVRGALGIPAVQALALVAAVYLAQRVLAPCLQFTDESDNVQGGLLIARGAVLYRDYVTQHMPVLYYLCSAFALIGAKSAEQMRLLWYLLCSALWGGLYLRHAARFGRARMAALALAWIVVSNALFEEHGRMILSDSAQALCMVALMLEFVRYLEDDKLSVARSAIVSLCVWGSFGSAFVSAYALAVFGIAFVCHELRRRRSAPSERIRVRYLPLCVCLAVPPVLAAAYFALNGSLRIAVKLCYLFNTEVYAQYLGGFGTKLYQPVLDAMWNTVNLPLGELGSLVGGSGTPIGLLRLLILVLYCVVLVRIARTSPCAAGTLLLAAGLNATRGYGFHGMAAWALMLTAIAVYGSLPTRDALQMTSQWAVSALTMLAAVLALGTYVGLVRSALLYDQQPVGDLESHMVSLTEPGDTVMADASICDWAYLIYRDRVPVNKCAYFLPWYMAWYENETIRELDESAPAAVAYLPDVTIWESYAYFTEGFRAALLADGYAQDSGTLEDGWRYQLWTPQG